jgi:membrane protein YdbS with pleckstrin-like domain
MARIAAVIVVIWLLIGVVAAVQRDYFSGGKDNCAGVSTVLVTIVAGPLNYVGANPKVKCDLPEPSK